MLFCLLFSFCHTNRVHTVHISPLPTGSTNLPSYCRWHYKVLSPLTYDSPARWQHVVVSILIHPKALLLERYLHHLFRSQTWGRSTVTKNKPSFQTYNLPRLYVSMGEQEKHLVLHRGGICGWGLLRHHYLFSLRRLRWGSKLRKIGLSPPAFTEVWGS